MGKAFERATRGLYPRKYDRRVREWLTARYGPEEAAAVWERTEWNYLEYLEDIPDYGGAKNGHAPAIYGGLLIFALYPALPDQPPIAELQEMTQSIFMEMFTKLGRVFDLNRRRDMALIDKIFRFSGNRDRRDIIRWPDGFRNVDAPYDRENRVARYSFTQCPNAEFAKKHGLLHVLPLMCNCDFFGIGEIHGALIRRGTCGNSDVCDYCVVGDGSPLASEYETVADEKGFLVSRRLDEKE